MTCFSNGKKRQVVPPEKVKNTLRGQFKFVCLRHFFRNYVSLKWVRYPSWSNQYKLPLARHRCTLALSVLVQVPVMGFTNLLTKKFHQKSKA